MDWTKTTARRDEKHWKFEIWCSYIRDVTVVLRRNMHGENENSDIRNEQLRQSYQCNDVMHIRHTFVIRTETTKPKANDIIEMYQSDIRLFETCNGF